MKPAPAALPQPGGFNSWPYPVRWQLPLSSPGDPERRTGPRPSGRLPADALKGLRDRAILATFLYHGLRREELCRLKVRDVHQRGGVIHLLVHGKGGKLRYVPAHPGALERIDAYLDRAGHREDVDAPLFRPVKTAGEPEKAIAPTTVYHRVVRKYARQTGLGVLGFCVHSLRATAATNALEHAADIAKVQE